MQASTEQQEAILHKDGPALVLAGPGSGKTTVITGRIQTLISVYHIPASQILVLSFTRAASRELEDRFREQETKTVRRLARLENKVLAMGGGVVLREENITCLKENGLIVFLDRSPEDIAGDVDTDTRPLLAAGRQRIYDLYAQRETLYRNAADITVVNKGELTEVLQRLAFAAKTAKT